MWAFLPGVTQNKNSVLLTLLNGIAEKREVVKFIFYLFFSSAQFFPTLGTEGFD